MPWFSTIPHKARCAAQLCGLSFRAPKLIFSPKDWRARVTGHPTPWPGPGGMGAQGGPGSALLQALTFVSPPSPTPSPPLRAHLSESLSLCSRGVSDTLSHYPLEGGGEPRTLQPNYGRACQSRGRGKYQRRGKKRAPRKGPFPPYTPGRGRGRGGGSWAAVDAQIAPAQAATGLWRGEMGSLMGSNCPGEGREGEKVEVSMGARRSG